MPRGALRFRRGLEPLVGGSATSMAATKTLIGSAH
jgi:hypothetical protein